MTDFLTRLAERTLRAVTAVPSAQPLLASMFAPEPVMTGSLPEVETWTTPVERQERRETQASFPARQPAAHPGQEVGENAIPLSQIDFEERDRHFRRGDPLWSSVVGADDISGNATPPGERPLPHPSPGRPQGSPPHTAAPTMTTKSVGEPTGVMGEMPHPSPGRPQGSPSPTAATPAPTMTTLTLAPLEKGVMHQMRSTGGENAFSEDVPEGESGEGRDQSLVVEDFSPQRGIAAPTRPEDLGEEHTHNVVQRSLAATRESVGIPLAEKAYIRQGEDPTPAGNTGQGYPSTEVRRDMPADGEQTDRLLVREAYSHSIGGLVPGAARDQGRTYSVIHHDTPTGEEGPMLPGKIGDGHTPSLQSRPHGDALSIEEQVEISSFASRVARSQVELDVQTQGVQSQPQQDMSGNKAISRQRSAEQHVLLTQVQSAQNAPHPQQTEQRLLVPQGEAEQGTTQPQQADMTIIETYSPAPTASRSPLRPSLERNNQASLEQHPALSITEAAPTQPTIRVTIGRIDVRAITAPAPAPGAKPGRRGPALSLDDYLKRSKGGGR